MKEKLKVSRRPLYSAYPGCPDGHVHGVEELEAEAVLLRGALDQLARAQHDGADPVTAL